MIFTARYNALRIKLFIFLCIFMIIALQSSAQRNACRDCKALSPAGSRICVECQKPLNKCLDCVTENPENLDYCEKCKAPMAEMRVLGAIASTTREDLKLGKSDRAIQEKELEKIALMLKEQPEQAEKLLYKRAKLLQKMNFLSRESEAWKEFLNKYPDSKKAAGAKVFLSMALRKWAYLMYEQKKSEEAINLLKEASEVNPMNDEVWSWLGRIYKETGKTQEAGAAYLKALELNPGDKTTIHFLRQLNVSIPDNLKSAKQ